MSHTLLAAAVVITFAVLIERMGLEARGREAAAETSRMLGVLRDRELDDRAKERALQRTSLRLFGLSLAIAGLGFAALILPLGAVWLLDRLGAASFSETLASLQRIDFLVVATLLGCGAYFASRTITRR